MMRVSCAAVALVALLGAGCSGGEEGAATPASPTPTTNTAGPQSPTNSSCTPAAPGNLRVTVTDSMRVFTWNAVSNVQDYFIQIGNASTAAGTPDLINTNTTQTTYTWTGASPGNYWARVYARNSCGSGPNSEQISFH
jgi:PBP1b-binding outer membrane lipoprotein LpoB